MSNVYSRIREVYITNFMSIKHTKIEFGEDGTEGGGITKVIGYNDTGKSAALRALVTALFYKWPKKQKNFIRDDESYFQVDIVFSDDVTLRFEKHSQGTALYELYQGEDLYFTTKLRDGARGRAPEYGKVTKVPDKIQEYLGLITTPDGTDLNYGVNHDKQLLVQTTGSENYAMINTVLKTEEISRAVSLLNSDNNALQTRIGRNEQEIFSTRSAIDRLNGLDDALVEYVAAFDAKVKDEEHHVNILTSMIDASDEYLRVPELPGVPQLDTTEVSVLNGLLDATNKIESTPDVPSVGIVDSGVVEELGGLEKGIEMLEQVPDIPDDFCTVELGSVGALEELFSTIGAVENVDSEITEITTNEEEKKKEYKTVIKAIESEGDARLSKCPNCGEFHLALPVEV